jgi:alpha-D-xyloside xylohydrolase
VQKKISRRDVGKGLAAVAMAAPLRGVGAQVVAGANAAAMHSVGWRLVAPGIWKATIGEPEKITPVRSRLVEMKPGAPVADACPLQPLHGEVRSRGVEVTLPLAEGEELFGFGLQFFSLAQRGKKRTIRVNADPKADTGDSHAPVPFYVSTRGYGVFVDTARYATFYCGECQTKLGEEPGKKQQPAVLAEVPNAKGVDVYVFAGPTVLDVVRRYNLFSGGGVMPPEWGLGFFYRTESSATAESALKQAKEFRDRQIPCDVIGLEPGWQTHAYSCTYVWNRQRFPDPEKFVRDMGAQQIRVNLWEHAYTNPASPLFMPLLDHAGDYGVWGGLVPDFEQAETRHIFGEYHGKNLVDIGICGFKLDECDNSDYTGGWSFPEISRFPSGVDGEQMHSLFGLRYQKTLWAQFEQRNLKTYSLVRSSGALAAPYPFVLYSDLYDHRQFVRALVTSSFSGLLWCPEVRDAKDEEDLIRRLQVVMFSPLAMVNGWYITNPPWKQIDRAKNNAGELAPDWEKLEARCREIIHWRMQIVPYLQAAFARYASDGTPPFRALAMDWPEIAAFAKVDDAWMVGDRMLVAPLFAGEAGRKLTLPPGEWHDYWNGEKVVGSAIEIPASTRNIPVYIKSGSVLPLATVTASTSDAKRRELTVHVYGDGRDAFRMELPSGEKLTCSWNGSSGTIESHGAQPEFKAVGWKQHV